MRTWVPIGGGEMEQEIKDFVAWCSDYCTYHRGRKCAWHMSVDEITCCYNCTEYRICQLLCPIIRSERDIGRVRERLQKIYTETEEVERAMKKIYQER